MSFGGVKINLMGGRCKTLPLEATFFLQKKIVFLGGVKLHSYLKMFSYINLTVLVFFHMFDNMSELIYDNI